MPNNDYGIWRNAEGYRDIPCGRAVQHNSKTLTGQLKQARGKAAYMERQAEWYKGYSCYLENRLARLLLCSLTDLRRAYDTWRAAQRDHR